MAYKVNMTNETYAQLLKDYELDIERALEIYQNATEEELVYSAWRGLLKVPDKLPGVLRVSNAIRKIGPPNGRKNTVYFDLISKEADSDSGSVRRYISRWGVQGVSIAHREHLSKETRIVPPSEQASSETNGNGQTIKQHRRTNIGGASVNDLLRVTLSNELRYFIREHKNIFTQDAIATLELFHAWLNENS